MASSSSARSLVGACKRLKLSPTAPSMKQNRLVSSSSPRSATASTQQQTPRSLPPNLERELATLRLPKAVQATYLSPLRREPQHGIISADLQLRSYSVRNLELFADFAMRAAYFLNLPARGPRPLPRITERWTVPRSNFVHKKSQENFERITMKRTIRILDGHPDTVSIWLAFLRKHQYYGVGLKADVWEQGGLETAKELDAEAGKISKMMGEDEATFELFAHPKHLEDSDKKLHDEAFKAQWGAGAPMSAAQSVPSAGAKISPVEVGQPSAAVPRAKVSERIVDAAAKPENGEETQKINIADDMVGSIIGLGGSKIDDIRKSSGARILISEAQSGQRTFITTGSPAANEKAIQLLHENLEAEKVQRSQRLQAAA